MLKAIQLKLVMKQQGRLKLKRRPMYNNYLLI